MKLIYDSRPTSPRYPHGYWYACTGDGKYDAAGPDPLTAITRLLQVLEEALK
ncbi:hypothetical protein [Nocardioides mesophilus]|uniref:Uncharacterized protein n=1 Tax=Nocardioides mesophilus TaxID=433659 RepID=A0A7G9RA72_9ACTN|nr:hypothetical protein [Nocardioides mesophilus]QNN52497.1 hypothetical protein H9L09_18815 [Nocardioides mesophilus]